MGVKQLYNPGATESSGLLESVAIEVRVAVRGSENQLPAEGLCSQDLRLSSLAE